MAYTDKSTEVAVYIKNKITTNMVALNVDTVLYGDHDKIPPGICVTVTPGTKTRTLARVAFPGAGTVNRMIILIMVYNSQMDSESNQRLVVDQVAEAIENLLHQDTTMGGAISHGYVDTWDPGVRFKENSMFRVTQMIFVGQSKTNLANIP